MLKRLSIVIPCYNEEAALPETLHTLGGLLGHMIDSGLISRDSGLCCVDDGSEDKTWDVIVGQAALHPSVHGIKLSGNRGHQNAIMAGMLTVPGDMVVTIDADLQDDIEVIASMIRHHQQGAEIVYGIRNLRPTDSIFKRMSANFYYKLLNKMGVNIILNHADFRLMGRMSIEALRQYREVNLFVRGIVPQLGFTTAYVEYVRKERMKGKSKYSLNKMLTLAWNGITSFSILPLRIIFFIGICIALASFVLGIYALYAAFFTTLTVPGWASTVVPLFFLSGIQLASVGIVGEYIGKIYMETKARPRFHIVNEI